MSILLCELNPPICMLKQGLIQPSASPWSFPVVVVKKKNGKFRLCVNYKPLNDITKKDNYPLPRIDELLDSLQNVGKMSQFLYILTNF